MEKEQRTYDETIEQHEDAQNEQASEEQVENEATQQEEKDELTLAYEKIAQLEAKLAETENRFLRLHADFDNYRRRVRLDMEAAEKYRAQSLVSDLLPILDNFERALQVQVEDEKAKSLLQGMEMVYRSLIEALKKEGVEAIESVGKPFDPHVHQAVMQVDDQNYEPNTVVEEFQKGYKLKDRVIRPAMVKVNQ
ncbi:nucleotide exchange factor GrpE [Anoxybacillus flavithermus]|uniref:nucleotide exchange factor GrpE n=1 Tax=Anoxybacillus flavithermus TaxID=33934 RepID=UPI0018674967|nr:nucleotide exchange factor GrpE [Anoxybacillus flavithermus]MBE2939446.1 nucleotide exchange factor GrpE [Anoxybacillus flavithermus]MBE2941989.1 nucleotide exchange factor GrpE [Anoxybacillus flavithermus]MBE2950227.1 nucleotide exchange factor GrpE [Anoxybacillus flavithermus]MBE2952976.1 nucleotide exchange factor GrpE [Anoxybacillus flavithermus]MBE2958329.1 nucleotide exchange factor GrpE [Anoxybacillus flavithermus]